MDDYVNAYPDHFTTKASLWNSSSSTKNPLLYEVYATLEVFFWIIKSPMSMWFWKLESQKSKTSAQKRKFMQSSAVMFSVCHFSENSLCAHTYGWIYVLKIHLPVLRYSLTKSPWISIIDCWFLATVFGASQILQYFIYCWYILITEL